MYILDTDHISILERAGHPAGQRLRKRMNESTEVCVATIISYEEQCRGWLSSIAQAKTVSDQISEYRYLLEQLRNYCAILVIEFDEGAAIEFQTLRKSKIRIGTMDLKIASIALARKATLLARNRQDFMKVPGLKIDDWTKEEKPS